MGGVFFFMKFMEILENELQNVKTYTDPTHYILTPKPFSMNPLWSFLDLLIYILANKGKSSTLKIEDFVENYFDDDEDKLITKQNLSQQRMKLDPNVFKEMNSKFITKFYQSEEYTSHFKDYIILLMDGSKSKIPNTPETKDSFNIYENSSTNKKALRTLFSTIIDAK